MAKYSKKLDVLLDHCFYVFGGSVILHTGINHSAVFIDSNNGQAQDLLADSQTASLGGVQCAELQSGVLLCECVNVGIRAAQGTQPSP